MKQFILIIIVTGIAWHASAQKAEVIKLPRLQQIMEARSEKIQIVNFWATFCLPCIEEIPYFQTLVKKYEKRRSFNSVGRNTLVRPNRLWSTQDPWRTHCDGYAV